MNHARVARCLAVGLAVGSSLMGCGTEPAVPEQIGQTDEAIVRGAPEAGFPQVVLIEAHRASGETLCSGTYIQPRVVLTAAHCLQPDTFSNGVFVYYGSDYATDDAQVPNIPPPGSPSVWAHAESWLVHPDYDPSVNYPDLAVVYLDRELPFAPLPLELDRVGQKYTGQAATIVGWGGEKALTADISSVEGAGVKRSGTAPIAGSPTLADYHPDDPNPGLFNPQIRHDLIKLDGRAPHANPCAGDSGGPLLLVSHHQARVAGVGMWTGLFCEDYSIFTRIDPFESFLKKAFDGLGKQPIVPHLECVRPLDDGRYRAYFGYENQNGISVEIPFSKQRNDFPADKAGDRPSTFGPGEHTWVFGVTFESRDQLRYQLVPKHGPATVLHVNRHSTACAADDPFAACAGNCEASLAAECADPALTFERCESECVQTGQQFAACQPEWNQYLECAAGVGPDESNWFCAPDFVPQPVVPDCNDAFNAAIVACGF